MAQNIVVVGGSRWSCSFAVMLLMVSAALAVSGAQSPTPDTFYQTHHDNDGLLVPAVAGIDIELLPILRNRRAAPVTSVNATDPSPTLVINSPIGEAATSPQMSVKPDRQLLGVNGTGQRRPVLAVGAQHPSSPTTLKPTLVSEPIISDDDSQQLYDVVDVNETETQTRLDLARAQNFTVVLKDFQFYNSSTYTDVAESAANLKRIQLMPSHSLLSKSHRRAVTVELTFDFPFYGHPVRNITVATGGFLYTGDYVHSWLAATQYIAPLMANFDSSLADHSNVRFLDNGTAFTVLWESIHLQDAQNITGNFTFSATLLNTGDVIFNYYTIPIGVDKIHEDSHPVKIGLSDAYIIERQIVMARRKTIYEYHRVNFEGIEIGNATIIRITPNPTCPTLKDCATCTSPENSSFKCSWCPMLNKCSTGTDRKRQEWMDKGCEKQLISQADRCPANGTAGNQYGREQTFNVPQVTQATQQQSVPARNASAMFPASGATAGSSVAEEPHQRLNERVPRPDDEDVASGFFATVFITVGLVMVLAVWLMYAYRNPHTKSGQLLIQYRPTQWSWRRNEARYTAATIHM